MADLITSTRAKEAILGQTTYTTAESTYITRLIAACSVAIQKYCRQEFTNTAYDELYDGTGTEFLQLDNYPLLTLSRVATNPTSVLTVNNTSAAIQRAIVQVTSTGLTLTHVASGTSTSNTLTFAGNATLSALATAIGALGNGWSATVEADFENWESADLRHGNSALPAKDRAADLLVHTEDVADFQMDMSRGWLVRRSPAWLGYWSGEAPCHAGWWPGTANYRVVYSAGYSAVPADVQEACAQWVNVLFHQAKRDPGLVQSQIVQVGSVISLVNRYPIPHIVKGLLTPYVRRTFGKART